jgi:hypothetical protein
MNPFADFAKIVWDLIMGFIALGIMTWEAKSGRTVGEMNPLVLLGVLALLIAALS